MSFLVAYSLQYTHCRQSCEKSPLVEGRDNLQNSDAEDSDKSRFLALAHLQSPNERNWDSKHVNIYNNIPSASKISKNSRI